VRPGRREDTLVASRPVCGARRSTSIARVAQVFFIQSLLRPVRYRTAGTGAKPPFLGISAYGGKATSRSSASTSEFEPEADIVHRS